MNIYYLAYEYVILPSNDLALDEMETQYNYIQKRSFTSENLIIADQFEVRSEFIVKLSFFTLSVI